MEGYAVLVEEAGFDTEAEKMAENHLIFVDAEKSQENYAIPSAFAAYAKYMGIRLGNEDVYKRQGSSFSAGKQLIWNRQQLKKNLENMSWLP